MIALQSLISLVFLLGLMVLYNQYRVDRLRDQLFALRDKLFDEARSGRVRFDSEGYRVARAVCNGMVRFAHEISIADFLAWRLLTPSWLAENSQKAFEQAFSAMSADEREVCRTYLSKMHRCVLEHLASSPFLVLTLVVPVMMVLLTRAGIDGIAVAAARLKGPFRSLDALAIAEGGDSVLATR